VTPGQGSSLTVLWLPLTGLAGRRGGWGPESSQALPLPTLFPIFGNLANNPGLTMVPAPALASIRAKLQETFVPRYTHTHTHTQSRVYPRAIPALPV
jgi:hypothetical protein